jgi:ATP-dependent HslUV protease ATP-binding subunit HslU
VIEKLLEDVSFEAGSGVTTGAGPIRIDAAYVDARLADLARNEDLARYVL